MDDRLRTAPAMAAPNNNEDEWEYEYSAEETETHYITIDLSIPEYLDRHDETIVHNTRGGYISWTNPMVKNPNGASSQNKILPFDDEDFGILDEEIEGEEDDEEDEEMDDNDDGIPNKKKHSGPRRRLPLEVAHAMRAAPKMPIKDPTEIQILDLHEDKPIISYRGTIFTGAWSTPIGTELIFARHDENDPMDVLRNLPQDVDLVGASSARVICTPIEHRKRRIGTARHAEIMRKTRATNRFAIPMFSDTYGTRQPQAHFIEMLMAMKKRKNETDEVTVFASDTKKNKVHDDIVEEQLRKRKAEGKKGSKRRYIRSQVKKGRLSGPAPPLRIGGRPAALIPQDDDDDDEA